MGLGKKNKHSIQHAPISNDTPLNIKSKWSKQSASTTKKRPSVFNLEPLADTTNTYTIDQLELQDRRHRQQSNVTTSIASTMNRHDCYHASVQLPEEEVKNLSNMYQCVQRSSRSSRIDLPPLDSECESEQESNDDQNIEDQLANISISGSNPSGCDETNLATKTYTRSDPAPPIPRILLEDFCGTCVLADAWCKQHVTNTAIGIDNDPAVTAYARSQTLIHSHSSRVSVWTGDVLDPTLFMEKNKQVDMIAALNYGVFYFHKRHDLIKYLKRCLVGLKPGGVLIADCFGGARVFSSQGRLFKRRIADFTYFFEQTPINPLTNKLGVRLHFRFDDGSWLKNAYTYVFRVYSITEIQEAMEEAGFSSSFIWIASSAEESVVTQNRKKRDSSLNEHSEQFDVNKDIESDSELNSDDSSSYNGRNTIKERRQNQTWQDPNNGVYEYNRVTSSDMTQLESWNAYIVAAK
ncbi:hypothetical protein QVD99_005543 [Batrachochytrium dendrobatidis]|nr:hypothetical protein QVD99_005543 [Batrachochytrium dendrobatidis]